METSSVLAQIWSDFLEAREDADVTPLAEVLGALLKVPVVGFVSKSDVFEPIAMFEHEELFPGATLGDVLDEEMGIFIESGAVVVFEPASFADSDSVSGQELGRVLGNILVKLAGRELKALSAAQVQPGVAKAKIGKSKSKVSAEFVDAKFSLESHAYLI